MPPSLSTFLSFHHLRSQITSVVARVVSSGSGGHRSALITVSQPCREFHFSTPCFRRKDRRSLTGTLPPEDEGAYGEKSVIIGQEMMPQFPTLETNASFFNNMLFTDIPIINIKCSQNNTIMSIFDIKKNKITDMLSCGTEGFRHCKKGTNVAGQAVGLSMGKRALAKGMDTFRLTIRGLGPGRASSVKGLEMAGIKIISITDRTPTPENGCKPRKARRV